MKIREVLKSDVSSLLLRWRYGPFVLVALWAVLHVLLGYELATGKMRLRWRFEWIEGRESSAALFWLYIAGSAGVLLLIDAYFLWSVFSRGRKKEPIQSPQRNAGSRPSSDDSPASETPSSLGPRG